MSYARRTTDEPTVWYTTKHTIKNLVAHKFYSDEQRQQGWRGENEESEQKSLKFTQVIVKNV